MFRWFGGELSISRGVSVWIIEWTTVYSLKSCCMDSFVGNGLFMEDPVYGWFGGELCNPGGPSVWIGGRGTLYISRL